MSMWFAAAFFERGSRRITGHEASTEIRGPFANSGSRTSAIKELIQEHRDEFQVAIVPFDIEGDDEATAEVAEE